MVTLLLKLGVEDKADNVRGDTVVYFLCTALFRCHVIDVLLQVDMTAMNYAAERGFTTIFKELYVAASKTGADVSFKCVSHDNLLYLSKLRVLDVCCGPSDTDEPPRCIWRLPV